MQEAGHDNVAFRPVCFAGSGHPMRFLLLWMIFLAAPAWPEHHGRVAGTVSDPGGMPLPGVSVTARGEGAAPREATTDTHGRYTLEALPAGGYELAFRLPHFASIVDRRVDVRPATTLTVDATLPLRATAEVLVSEPATFRELTTLTTTDHLLGIAGAASSGVVTAGQLEGRPLPRAGDLIERVPGVVISQHSGDGKANQYYVRGFDIDHGTDLAVSVAGLLVNMPTHAHGQGYADLGFLIPELISGIQYRKGTHHADQGDFSAAGAVQFNYASSLPRPIVALEAGPHRYGRLLGAASSPLAGGHVLYAAEAVHDDGPWEVPEAFRKWNGVLRYSRGTAQAGFQLTALAYDARWRATDQIPSRAVSDGRLSRWGSLDPTDGGRSFRHSLSFEWQRAGARTSTRAQVYGIGYGLNLYSNFTYFLDDPVRGDQFEQEDRRRVAGGQLGHQWLTRAAGFDLENRVGLQVRHDDIGALGLHHTQARRRLDSVREDAVRQTSASAHAESTVQWTRWLRTIAGLRGDSYRFDVDSGLPANTGRARASRLSPKLSAIFGPWSGTELYLNAGHGFHSNDGRGATARVDPRTGEALTPVDALVPARGAEVGLRTLALRGVHVTATLWTLGLDSELVFAGDAGTTEESRPSRRNGVELAAEYGTGGMVALDASLGLSRARFVDGDPAGPHVPGTVTGVASIGALIDAGRWRGSLRLRWVGPRSLTENGAVRAPSSTIVGAQALYRWTDRLHVQLEATNLLDTRASDVEYFYVSRLPGEPSSGVADVHTHPAAPRTLRLGVKTSF